MPRLALLCLLAGTLAAADDDPTDVLIRVQEQVTALGQRIPNHVCVETIQRDRFQPTGSVPRSCDALLARRRKAGPGAVLKAGTMDRLRLDVALADGHEIYSWAGARKFEQGDDAIHDLIQDGPIGTGMFASMLLSTFGPGRPRFFYDGETTLGGQHLMQYSFNMLQEQSEYRVKTDGGWWKTGYTGTLLVEPQTATLVRILIRTDELPRETHACEVDSTLDYATVQLGGLGYLLPKAAHQRFISYDGSEAENAMTFASCQEYKAEASLVFPTAPPREARPQPLLKDPGGLPEGLQLAVELTSDVALDQAAAGDQIEGRLAAPIRGPPGDQLPGQTFAPAGAIVAGRLMRVETRYSAPRDITVVFRWETIELDGATTPLSLKPVRDSGGGITVNGPPLLDRLKGLRTRGLEIELPRPGEARYGLIHFYGDHPVMKSGLRSNWVTAKP